MFYSGLVVTCKPGQFASVGEALKSLPVEVHQSDAASGRYVVVLEDDLRSCPDEGEECQDE